ncbi:uncharacterized protein PHALS_03142 [Plasmopara halstedii]|uniref:Uncharacterized protein n=1 Tax=Plasmopara halstedii TaxID=4781 RepID=A0A0P1A7Y1_PLAHL|nr:uncharacterized protein PHALS_03142 [Plasmopara halstedii]CEG36597.1 hypothetical protein PHALS_03142 [Plasmopara halstedii]|eukprot:XP_024572966.1 hypothetical protein PHALS_03142 [Plasmopara halstedii]
MLHKLPDTVSFIGIKQLKDQKPDVLSARINEADSIPKRASPLRVATEDGHKIVYAPIRANVRSTTRA